MRTENKMKIICAIVAIVFGVFVAGNIFLGLFTKYLQSPAREDDYVEAVSDDGVWKVYLLPDWFGFVRGYIIPQTEETPDKIKVFSKEGDYSNKETERLQPEKDFKSRANVELDYYTPAEAKVLKGKKYFNCIEDEAGVSEKVLIPITIKWEDKTGKQKQSKATIKYDKWNANDWFSGIKACLGMDIF